MFDDTKEKKLEGLSTETMDDTSQFIAIVKNNGNSLPLLSIQATRYSRSQHIAIYTSKLAVLLVGGLELLAP